LKFSGWGFIAKSVEAWVCRKLLFELVEAPEFFITSKSFSLVTT
jgi:hypothetical protein